jgi:hypothetical protein
MKSVSALASMRFASPMWSGRAGRCGPSARGVVAMGVRHEDVRDRLAAHGVEQGRDVRGIVGAGVDDRDLAAPDDVADRALEGERARIVGKKSPHPGRGLVDLAGREIQRLVEWDVVGHGAS